MASSQGVGLRSALRFPVFEFEIGEGSIARIYIERDRRRKRIGFVAEIEERRKKMARNK